MYVILLDNCCAGPEETQVFFDWDKDDGKAIFCDVPKLFETEEDAKQELEKIKIWLEGYDEYGEFYNLRYEPESVAKEIMKHPFH